MTAEILSVGTELLLGNTINSDAAEVARALSELGVNVYAITVVGDNPERLREAVMTARDRADILITTGGLGPTVDDLTKQTVAGAFGKKLIRRPELVEEIRGYYQKMNRDMTENNLRQADLPEGCTVLQNDWGTAPGCAFEAEGKTVIMLPGPPMECRNMLHARAVPYLEKLSDRVIRSHFLHIYGIGESRVETMLHDMMAEMKNPTVAPYAKEGEVMVRVTASAKTEREAEGLLAPIVKKIQKQLGDLIYAVDKDSLEQAVLDLLVQKGKTLATAESCTGGLLGKRLTDLPGSSRAYVGGVVSYCDALKTSLLGVPEALLKQHGAVSEPVARAMAEGAVRITGADMACAVTGLAGPDGDGSGKPVGLVYTALSNGKETWVHELQLGRIRERTRVTACNDCLDMVRRYVAEL